MKVFVQWYNHDHRHSRIKIVAPQQRHTGEDIKLLKKRQRLYSKMMKMYPVRWLTTTRNWQHEPIVELTPKHYKERNVA